MHRTGFMISFIWFNKSESDYSSFCSTLQVPFISFSHQSPAIFLISLNVAQETISYILSPMYFPPRVHRYRDKGLRSICSSWNFKLLRVDIWARSSCTSLTFVSTKSWWIISFIYLLSEAKISLSLFILHYHHLLLYIFIWYY